MQVGDIVDGRYRLLDLLGEGAAGKVFRAEDLGRNNMFVALKLLHAKDPRWEGFFRREFEVLSRLHHPNLVSVYDFGPAPEENTWYFTQELVVGRPLLEAAAGQKVDDVIGLFIEVCRALEFIHGHGVLHRDLKPANILVQQHAVPGERVRVLDFGLWRELDNTPQRGARWAGTPPYLASEVLRGFGHSITADLYAVGVTLFQVLTRKLPHGRGTPQELLAARKVPAPDLTDVVKPGLAPLIARLLSEEPTQRPQLAAEVAAQLSHLVPNSVLAMPLALGRARLVGRDAERQRLFDAVDAVREKKPGAPRLAIVEGPDGIGKTRLVEELKAEVQLKGGRAALGRCMEDVRFSYRPIAELVRTLPRSGRVHLSDSEKDVISRLLPEESGAGRFENGASSGTADRERFHGAAIDLFVNNFAGATVCVLIVEDVSFCDAASADLLAGLVARARDANILVVVTVANDHGPVPDTITKAAGADVLRTVLKPLPRDDVARLLCGLLAVPAVPDAFAETITAHARGMPLMVEELLALMIARGDLRRGDVGWLLDEWRGGAGASTQILNVLNERLQRLSTNERRTLFALAVFNRPSGPKLLAALAGIDVVDVRQALSVCEAQGLIRVVDEEDGRPRVIFRHPNIRDALLEALEEMGEIARWHRTCAEVLEQRAGKNVNPIAETLAHHHERAGDLGKAVPLLLVAAEHAMASFDFDGAIGLARQAARLIAKTGADIRNQVRADVIVGKAMVRGGQVRDARAFLDLAVGRENAAVAADDFGELHVWLAHACNQLGAPEAGLRAATRALQMLDERRHPVAVARILFAQAALLLRTDPHRALVEVARAHKLLGDAATPDDLLSADELVTHAALSVGDTARAVAAARRRVELARKRGRVLDEIPARRALAEALAQTGERLEARNHLNTALELAQRSGHRAEQALLLRALGEQLFVSGAYPEAIVRYQNATTLSAQMGQIADRAECLLGLGRAYFAKGDYDRALDHLRAAVESFEKQGDVGAVIITQAQLAVALLSKNVVDDAAELIRSALRKLPEAGLDHARAQVSGAQGLLFMAKGEYKRARDGFLTAAMLYRAAMKRYELGSVLTDYGQLLLRVREPRRALRIARRAELLFTALDARGQLKRLQPLLNASAGLATARREGPRTRLR